MQSLFPRLRQLFLPFFALPNDPAIIIGPDLPPCMQSRYSSAFFFRPPNTASDPLNRPLKYIGQVINPVSEQVDEGFAIWDQSSICGYYVYKTTIATLAPSGSGNSIPQEFYNQIAQSGVATMTQGGSTNFGSTQFGVGTGWTVNIGDGTATPALAAFNIDGRSYARGLKAQVSSTVSTGAVAGESVVLTAPSMTFYNGRAYQVLTSFDAFGSVANNPTLNVRQTNLAGAQLLSAQFAMPAGTVFGHVEFTGNIVRTAGTDLTDNVALTLQSNGVGTVTQRGGTTTVRRMEVRDIGAASNYPNAIAI